jgi:HlyD family secretion protein
LPQLHKAEAEKLVAEAELARINVGTRSEIIAQRKAEIDRAAANLTFAQQTYNRTKQLAADKFAPQSKLDEDADALTLAQKRLDQANLGYQEAVKGFTAEEGEVVTPGVPLLSLVDLADTWLGFSLREYLTAGLKVGDRFAVNIPALGNRELVVEVRVIATKGEYAGWRATRATGDFDLRTFAIRAYPVEKAVSPADVFTATQYHRTWFWIAEDDFDSKLAFTVLQILLALARTENAPGAIVTIPAG